MNAGDTNFKNGWRLDNSYSCLPTFFYTRLTPTPVKAPKLVLLNRGLAERLGLSVVELESDEGVSILAGNRLPPGADPLAQAYAGHQFGYFTMLGDGRAILLGEQITPDGCRFDIQLKGAGITPYSRGGDGRAALSPMLREYLISEAMHALGIPTTRSLAVVTTGESVWRDREWPGAVLTRVAASHLRVGTFEYAARMGHVDLLRTLADYAWERHFLAADPVGASTEEESAVTAAQMPVEPTAAGNRYLTLLREVIKRQAQLIAKWQLVGFIHGVMNTDNMAISGETIDYGPCAFMDTYDPATVFSSIDYHGRYAYGNQPIMAAWNLARFAEALLSLLHDDEDKAASLAQKEVSRFPALYHAHWLAGMRMKLGLFGEEAEDENLIVDLLALMQENKADYTNTFLALTYENEKMEGATIFASAGFATWYERWQARLARQKEPRKAARRLMRQSNPALIPRNHRVEEALEAAVERNDLSILQRFLDVLAAPYAHLTTQAEYAALPPPSDRPYCTFCGT